MENSQLTIADLGAIHSMLDTAASRGAFRAEELASVGALYEKTMAFLKQSGAITNAVKEPDTEVESK